MTIPIGKIALGVGVLAGAGAAAFLLTGCGPDKDPTSEALDEYQDFDRNRDNQWTNDETTSFATTRPYTSGRFNSYRVGDYRYWTQNIQHDEVTSSMAKAYAAARGNDGIASLEELSKLAISFDKDAPGEEGYGLLDGGERRAFQKQYGVDVDRRVIVDSTETGYTYDPIRNYPSTYPDYDYPSTYPTPGTSSGDDPIYEPSPTPGNGTSSGDD